MESNRTVLDELKRIVDNALAEDSYVVKSASCEGCQVAIDTLSSIDAVYDSLVLCHERMCDQIKNLQNANTAMDQAIRAGGIVNANRTTNSLLLADAITGMYEMVWAECKRYLDPLKAINKADFFKVVRNKAHTDHVYCKGIFDAVLLSINLKENDYDFLIQVKDARNKQAHSSLGPQGAITRLERGIMHEAPHQKALDILVKFKHLL